MTDEQLKAFVIDLLQMHHAGDWMDIDGGDMDALYRKHGFVEDRPATAEDVAADCGDYGIEEGELSSFWTPEVLEMLGVTSA